MARSTYPQNPHCSSWGFDSDRSDYPNVDDNNPETTEDADNFALQGSYGIGDQIFSLNADILDLDLSSLLTARVEGLSINYDPEAADGQEILGVEISELTFTPFDWKSAISGVQQSTDKPPPAR